VWSRFEEEYARLEEEQTQERLIAERKAREALWQRRKLISSLQDKALQIGAVSLITIYLLLLFWLITIDRKIRWGF
jgi:regulatory protein YycI of two-component signal transduction system YycFG